MPASRAALILPGSSDRAGLRYLAIRAIDDRADGLGPTPPWHARSDEPTPCASRTRGLVSRRGALAGPTRPRTEAFVRALAVPALT